MTLTWISPITHSSLHSNKLDTMKIEILTINSESLQKSGFQTSNVSNTILDSIEKIGHNARLEICENIEDLNAIVNRKPDLVILAVKYILDEDGEKIWLCEFFTKNKINFSGSLKETLMYDSNSVLAKEYLKTLSISTARYFTTIPGEHKRDYDIPINYPLFLKPSEGEISIDKSSYVNSFAEFDKKVIALYDLYKVPILAEEYLDGQEFTVSMIKKSNGELLVGAIEIIPPKESPGIGILGETIPNDNPETLRRIENSQLMERVQKLAIDVYIDLEIRDYARVDIKSKKNGECFFKAVNLVPGVTDDSSYFTKAFEMELGLSYTQMLEHILDEGTSRAS